MPQQQLFLDLDFTPPVINESDINHDLELKAIDIRCAVIAWLTGQNASGMATKPATHLSHYRADLAAFWNRPRNFSGQPGPARMHVPCHTMIVEVRKRRQDCWPDFTSSAALLPRLRELKRERAELEADIRNQEPELRENTTLFDEFSDWNYEQSENDAYHRACREIDRLNKAIYKGTRFEWIRNARVADFLYLAVPENTVHPHELADDWGLLWVKNDQSVELIAQAANQNCPVENRFHLVQNIAAASTQDILFRYGIHLHKDQTVEFLRRPARRQPKRKKA